MRWIVGGKAIERQAASTSQMGRFETGYSSQRAGVWIDKVHDRHPPEVIARHGQQRQPDPWRTRGTPQWSLRLYLLPSAIPVQPVRRPCAPVMCTAADGWRNALEPVVMRYKERKMPPSPHRRYTNISKPITLRIRLKANAILQRYPRDPPARPCSPFPRQLQLSGLVEQEAPCRGPHPSWFLASARSSLICRALPSGWWRSIITWHGGAAHLRNKNAIKRPVCMSIRNAVRHPSRPGDLGNFMRTLALPKELERWSMTTLRDKHRGQGCPTGRLRSNWLTWRCRGTCSFLIDDLRRRPAPRRPSTRCVWMAMTDRSKSSTDGHRGYSSLAVGKWYDFHEFGWYMGMSDYMSK